MRRARVMTGFLCLLATTCFAGGASTDLVGNVPEATRKLYDKFAAEYTAKTEEEAAKSELVKQLAAAADADLCFLHEIDAHDYSWRTMKAAREQLGKLNTQRTFDVIAGRLKSEKWEERSKAVWAISAFKRAECVTMLINILETDENEKVQINAARRLEDYADPRAEPALLKAARGQSLALARIAASALAPLKSKEGLSIAVALMEKAQKGERERAIIMVSSFRTKDSMAALLKEFARLSAEKDALETVSKGGEFSDKPALTRDAIEANDWINRLYEVSGAALQAQLSSGLPELGPFPDRRLDEWQDWWPRAQPLLTYDLKLKTTAAKPAARKWRDDEFSKTTEGVTFSAAVDAQTFRVGDPIRLNLVLANHGKDPCSLVRPGLPSGWMPTMAYGIKLKRGDNVVADLAPSDFYLGSYSGPPAFEMLAPGDEFRSSVCFQYWTRYLVSSPLPEGDYELTITFDSSKFAGMSPKGIQLVHRWEAPAIKFTVKGEALRDPQEILALIAAKTQLKFMVNDLTSPQLARHDPAWLAVHQYGDSRLAPFVEKIQREQPDKAPIYVNAGSLRPFE